jgi:2-iminobutanoate/2-iminopropanoate deaminase
MPKTQISTSKGSPPGGPYSQAIRAGDYVFVAGQVGRDPATGQVAGDTIEAQTRQTLENMKAILEAAGASMADVVKVGAHLTDLSLFDRYNSVYVEYFPEPRPARTTVGSKLLGTYLVEIDAIAYVGA